MESRIAGKKEECQALYTVRISTLSYLTYSCTDKTLSYVETWSRYLADGGEDMEEVNIAAFRKFIVSNSLHPDAFPAVRKMEAEVVSMCLRMYNNPTGAGTMTSGGTESIVLAVKTHRDWARDVKDITEPEM